MWRAGLVHKSDRRLLQPEGLERRRGIAVTQDLAADGLAVRGSADVAVERGRGRGQGAGQIRRNGNPPMIRLSVTLGVRPISRGYLYRLGDCCCVIKNT